MRERKPFFPDLPGWGMIAGLAIFVIGLLLPGVNGPSPGPYWMVVGAGLFVLAAIRKARQLRR